MWILQKVAYLVEQGSSVLEEQLILVQNVRRIHTVLIKPPSVQIVHPVREWLPEMAKKKSTANGVSDPHENRCSTIL